MKYLALLPLLVATAAWSAEPPACSDKGVTEAVREMFWETKLRLSPVPKPTDGNAYRAYSDFQINDVVSNGYESGIKRRSCSATTGKGRNPIKVTYTVQVTETDSARNVVKADFRDLPDELAIALREAIVRAINKP